MRKLTLFTTAMALALLGCQDNEEPIIPAPEFNESESEWIRLGAWDQEGQFTLISPTSETANAAEALPFKPDSRNYLSTSGRYIVSMERNDGRVKFFDTGIDNHGDHGHEYEMRWLNATADAPLPTHFSATNGNIIIFNDGDGSVTLAREASMEAPSFQPTILSDLGNGTHHGAATWLSGNKLAVTFQDENASGALPQYVKIIDTSGNIIAEDESVSVTGLHGDASNGTYAVFGGTEGVIVADANDQIKLIENPSPLEPTSGNWMGTIRAHDNLGVFYGLARNHGVFEIDPAANSIRSIFSADNIRTYFLSAEGSYLIIQTNDNRVRVFDTQSGSEIANAIVQTAGEANPAISKKELSDERFCRLMEDPVPVLTASDKYLYVLEPNRSKIHVRELSTLDVVGSMDSPANTVNIMRVGFHSN